MSYCSHSFLGVLLSIARSLEAKGLLGAGVFSYSPCWLVFAVDVSNKFRNFEILKSAVSVEISVI